MVQTEQAIERFEEQDGEDEQTQGPETMDPEDTIVEMPVVQVKAQDFKVTGEQGKIKVSFSVEGADQGIGVGKLMRMTVVGGIEVAIRSRQLELPE